MYSRNSSLNKIFWKRIIKNPQKISFSFSNPVSFCGCYYEKWKGSGTSYHPLLKFPSIFGNVISLMINHPSNFDDLTQRGFWVIKKITTDNLIYASHFMMS